MLAVGTVLAIRWRTEIHHDRVVIHRGLGRREVRWSEVTAVSLSQARPIDVTLRLVNYCSVDIRASDGAVIELLVTARAAHAAYAATVSAAAPPPTAAAARIP